MKKLNLPPFYIGQKVVYITGNNMPKDSIHTVTNVYKYPCGCFVIEIDDIIAMSRFLNTTGKVNCVDCNKTFNVYNKFIGWDCKSFRPLEELKASIMTLEKIKEAEKEEILINN